MTNEIVISPILDIDVRDNVAGSPIWDLCFRPEEVDDQIRKKFPVLYKYEFKFDGLKPVQFLKMIPL